MSKVVSKEEMSALMNATAPKDQADSKRVSGYDFKHPFLISREQLRFISAMHEGLARKFTDYLSEKSNSSISVSIGSSDQIQFWEFIKSLKTPATIFHGTIKLPEAKIMVDFDTKLALVLVDKILGGTGEVDEEKTKLTDIEKNILTKVANQFSSELSKAWLPLREVNSELSNFESDPESVRIAQQLDPVVTVNIKVKMDDEDSKITLCYPYNWIQNILASPAAKNKVISTEKSSSDDEKATMSENLQLVKVPMKAKLGTAKLSFKNIIELEEGDLVILNNKTHEEIDIEMIDKLLYTASIGVSNGKYACKINNVIIGGK